MGAHSYSSLYRLALKHQAESTKPASRAETMMGFSPAGPWLTLRLPLKLDTSAGPGQFRNQAGQAIINSVTDFADLA
jgi:hypothetical protein